MVTSTRWSRSRLRLPLWAVLTLPFIFLLAAAISVTGFLALRNSQHVVHDMAGQFLDEIAERINVHLMLFLQTPHDINESNANLMRLGLLSSADQEAVQRYLWEQVQVYASVTSIYFGNAQGGIITSGREGADGSLYVMVSDNFAAGPMSKYATDDSGNPTDTLVQIENFDARTRPWYTGALDREGPSWSPPYVLSTGQDLAIAASRPVYAESGDLLGVTSVDLFFSHVSNFLHDLAIGETGQAYIVEHSGFLIATSNGTPTFTTSTDNTNTDSPNPIPQRIAAQNSTDPMIAASANYIIQRYGEFPEHALKLQITLDGEPSYLRVIPYHDPRGLDWLIVITVPEQNFLAQIDKHNETTILLSIVALMLAAGVGIVTALQVLRPLTRLNDAATALGQDGRWSEAVPVSGPREIQQLGQSFNVMASQLHELITHLEERVQERTQAVIASEARYRAIVEDQTELICRFTPDTIMTFVNGAYCRYYNKTQGELIGTSFMPSLPEEDQAALATQLATLSPDNPVVIAEHRVIKTELDGKTSLRWMQWVNRRLVDEFDGQVEIQGVGRDITEQKRLALALQKALDREIELNQLKTHFVSTVSHEFRTPLSIILNATEMLERYATRLTPEKQHELFRRIGSQITHMASLLDDVFMINQAQRGRAEFSPTIINLTALCETSIQYVRTSTDSTLDFVFVSQEDVCVDVKVDENLSRLIMVNLISNAAKYSQPGGTITIKLTCTEEHVEFMVHDEGIGIPKDAHAEVFTPFFRADNIGIQPGTGLGLAIAKQSVDLHGGTITFESEEGQGTTFVVTLPNIAFLEKQHAEDFNH